MLLSGFLSSSSQEIYLTMAEIQASSTFFIQPHFINLGRLEDSDVMYENCPFQLMQYKSFKAGVGQISTYLTNTCMSGSEGISRDL